ncbi:MAG: DoxX family protein [Prevotellaceae bacterium]|jgi:uncharacterized membrane protein YphA (DoxX/SURF4 family)|nr:DoxX family protein [Prevotellaceae bacterium]
MKILRIICRVLIGVLFIFSGYVKAIDPVGSQIIFSEYFSAFRLDFFIPWAPFLVAYLASTAELLIGCCALMGIRMKETAWAAMAFMIFFTILTFILALTNLVTDCGCFGNAIKMTNWQTFFKNLIILPFVIVLFLQRKRYRSFASCRAEWITVGILAALPVLLSVYCYRHLPLIDFMAYKVGVNISDDMSYPENAAQDEWEVVYRYEKEGKVRSFSKETMPWQDSSWVFVSTQSILKKKGYEPPIHDFTITPPDGGDYVTDSILNLPGYTFLLIMPHVEQASTAQADRINALADYCLMRDDRHFLALSGSDYSQNERFAVKTGAMYPFFTTDEKPLLSMVRSNPGLLILHEATVLAKYSRFDIPTPAQVEAKITGQNPDKIIAGYITREQLTTDLLALLFAVAMILWGVVFRQLAKRAGNTALSAEPVDDPAKIDEI